MTTSGLGYFIHEWQTLIGVLLSGLITLFAASLAWRAVQHQISNQRAIASRVEDDAFTAIKEGAAELYGMLNLIWRAVDAALQKKSPESMQANFTLVEVLKDTLPNEKNIDSLLEIAQQLGPTKHRKFLLFTNMLRTFYEFYRAKGERLEQIGISDAELAEKKKMKLISLRIYLSHLHKYLEAFDPESAVVFVDRVHSKVDHRKMHEHLESMVADAERGKNFIE
jgi:hypothetical protein